MLSLIAFKELLVLPQIDRMLQGQQIHHTVTT